MKNIVNKPKIGAGLSALAFSLMISTNVQAQSCTTVPTCDELGYTKSAADCGENDKLRCPFDSSLFFCPSGGSATSLAVGDILFSDMTTSPNLVTGKTPIGVVFDVTNRLAIAKDTKAAYWSTAYFDIDTLSNITSSSAATADWQGKDNTATILAYCKDNHKSCSAVEYVNSYTTAGTNAGDWHLPAGGELNAIYSNKTALNVALSKIGGKLFGSERIWSSSEQSYNTAWYLDFYDGSIRESIKNYVYHDTYVRPVLAF